MSKCIHLCVYRYCTNLLTYLRMYVYIINTSRTILRYQYYIFWILIQVIPTKILLTIAQHHHKQIRLCVANTYGTACENIIFSSHCWISGHFFLGIVPNLESHSRWWSLFKISDRTKLRSMTTVPSILGTTIPLISLKDFMINFYKYKGNVLLTNIINMFKYHSIH